MGKLAVASSVSAIDTRNRFFDVWNVYWPIALAVFLVVLFACLFLLLRYRSPSPEFPRGKDENEPLEIGYMIGLTCIAAFLVFLTFSRMPGEAEEPTGGPPVEVEVTAARWNWRFEYSRGGAIEQGSKDHVPVLRVPVDTPIRFSGTSLDVIHSFWIPEERFKRDVFPGKATRWEMVFDEVENLPAGGECAEFCGLEHSRMIFDVLVMPREAFARWADS